MRCRKNIWHKLVAAFLSALLCISSLAGCTQTINNSDIVIDDVSSEDNEKKVPAKQENAVNNSTNINSASDELTQNKNDESDAQPMKISADWEDYVGDLDTFVYGILMNDLEQKYDVFNACVDLPDGTEVFGIGYTDYGYLFESDDDSIYFPAGFISNIGEPNISESAISDGLEIVNLDLQDMLKDYKYVLAYSTEPYIEHCVIWGQYLKYGIDENGSITYSAEDYNQDKCDETLGSLYSYDDDRYIYDPEVGNAIRVNGFTLQSLIDYDELEAEVNRILEEQDYNFSKSEVESAVYVAQEALNSYLLSKQDETFMGVSVRELLRISQTLDPMECVRFTSDGMAVVDMSETPPTDPTQLAKWLTGACCVTALAASIAVNLFVPAAAPLCGAISSTSVEVFLEVVIQNQTLSDVNWRKVALAAASGVTLAWICPALGSSAASGTVKALEKTALNDKTIKILGKLAGYGVLSFSNGCVSGVTGAAYSVLDGGTQEDAVNAFKWGVALGAGLTLLTSGINELVNAKMISTIENEPNSWFAKFVTKTETVGTWLSDHQIHLKNEELESILAPKSVAVATESALYEVRMQRARKEILDMFVDNLPSNDNPNLVLVDPNTNEPITKAQLKSEDLNGNCVIELRQDCDEKIKELFKRAGIKELNVVNGQVDFSPVSTYEFKPSSPMTSNRDDNYRSYYKELANTWNDPNVDIPDEFVKYFQENNISRENLVSKDIREMFSALKLTPHEGADGIVYFVSTELHGLVSHGGGVAQALALEKIRLGTVYFKDLAHATATGITGTLIAEGVQP